MADGIDILLAAANAAKEERLKSSETQNRTTETMIGALQKNRQLDIMQQSANTGQSVLGINQQKLENEKLKAEQSSKLLNTFLSAGASNGGMQIKGFTHNGMNFEDPNFEARKKTATKGAADEAQINNFTSGLAQILKNMESASPGDTDPTSARLSGIGAKLGSMIGAADPKVTAELDTLNLKARSTIKEFESGRLTESDVTDAAKSITGIDRNTTERLAKTVSLSRQIAADRGVDPAIVDERLASSLGISVEQMNAIVEGKIKPKEASQLLRGNKQTYKVGDTKNVGGTTYVRGEDGKWRPKS